ncbi:beta-N-acetylhexosaminidase [Hyphomicrobium sp. NDB2Meth4]|uniref:beta-N-acetylhexosaminidase n=1 Tax=Hyphomicrobium sp. NDB2Meth4 TaxID=1892846 RepID=UPI000931483E|nr:beta-N-acetylhexosaminidase [Hyphomicrobium sp. NDB2Meth4]
MRTALIVGAAGTELSPDEVRFLKDARPAGFILFARNLKDHAQIRALISDVRAAVGADDVLVLIDQEGGRVQRLRPPLGRALPPAAAYGALYAGDREAALAAAFEATRLLAADLVDLGINTDCAPVLDLPVPGSHDIIGDRAYGRTVEQVVALAKAVADGFMAGGVVPVIKHIPGHGRATADSHLALPVVTETREELIASDFAPFKALSHLPAAMSAHVVFRAIDPDAPASTSSVVIQDVIRGLIGFDGLLMSDDLSMKALSGPMRQRAEAVIAAGSDLALHCNGDMAEMVDAAEGSGRLEGRAKERFDTALNITKATQPFDSAAAEAQLAKVLAFAAGSAESV